MKKIIFLCVIIFNLYSYEKKITINKSILSSNYFIPSFLRFNPKPFLDSQISYDTLNEKKLNYYIHLRIKLPSIKINLQTKNKQTDKNITKIIKNKKFFLTIRPYIRIKSKKIKFFIGNFLYYKSNKYSIQENLYFYLFTSFWENSLSYSYFFKKYTFNTIFSLNKNLLPAYNYFFSINKTFFYNRHLFNISYSINGISNQKPIISTYKISVEYRQILFNQKRLFFTLKPYIISTKKWNFNLKIGVFTSINYKF